MEINNLGNIDNQKPRKQNKLPSKKHPETKDVQASSLEALGNYGKAALIPFKSSVAKPNEDKVINFEEEFKKLADGKFSHEETEKIINRTYGQNAVSTTKKECALIMAQNDKFSSENIMGVLDAIDSNQQESNKKDFFRTLSRYIELDMHTGDEIESAMQMLNYDQQEAVDGKLDYAKWLIDNTDYDKKNIAKMIEAFHFSDKETTQVKMDFIEELLQDKRFSHKEIVPVINSIQLSYAPDVKSTVEFTKFILNDTNFTLEEAANIIVNISCEQNISEVQENVLHKLIKSKKFTNEEIKTIHESLRFSDETTIKLKEDWLNELLQNGKFSGNDITQLINSVSSGEKEKEIIEKIDFLKTLLDNTDLEESQAALLIANQETVPDSIKNLDYKKDFPSLAHDAMEEILKLSENIDPSDYEGIIQKAEASLRKALKCPRQYLDNIPIKHTEKNPNNTKKYKIENLPEIVETEYKKRIINFFAKNLETILEAYSYVDSDTINTMMDKRSTQFESDLDNLLKLGLDNLELLSELLQECKTYKVTTNGETVVKPLAGSGRKKVELCEKIETLQSIFDTDLKDVPSKESDVSEALQNMLKTGEIDFDKLGKIINEEILKKAGITQEEFENSKDAKPLNEKFSHLIFSASNPYGASDKLDVVIRASYDGKFDSFINDKNNVYGQINEQTRKEFKENALSFKKWNNPGFEKEFDFRDQKMKVRLWERNPKEDLFIGNKTSCCSAIGAANGAATPIYLLNKCFNVIEMKDSRGDTIGMARVFMAQVDNKPALIMDNIELNSNYKGGKTTTEEKEQLRNAFFDYAKEYAKRTNNDNVTPVYFSTSFTNVPTNDLKQINKALDFIGTISKENDDEKVYMNIVKNAINPKNLKDNKKSLYIVSE